MNYRKNGNILQSIESIVVNIVVLMGTAYSRLNKYQLEINEK